MYYYMGLDIPLGKSLVKSNTTVIDFMKLVSKVDALIPGKENAY